MVAKISTGGNMFGALAYNQNKVDSGEAKVLFSNRMLLGEDGNFSIGECMRSFEMQMPVQLSTKKPILHISINPHPEDVLLRAAECENEVNGPTQQAIDWINEVRNRADLPDLELADFPTADKLFEQIANVERPKEFGCEFGRGFDLIRWGFFYKNDRLQQLKEHSVVRRSVTGTKDPVDYNDIATDSELKSSFDTYLPGHEFLPIVQQLLNKNPNLSGNSANFSTDNSTYFSENGWTVHPVVDLSK